MLEGNTALGKDRAFIEREEQAARNARPAVSIGMPVYNGERSIRLALDSLRAQTFSNFELIISDNASTDGTEAICREYAARDNRIKYLRQSTNLGVGANFKFVLDVAQGEYFMWAACDDIRSSDFIEVNAAFLAANPGYVASTSPNGFEGRSMESGNLVSFALDGDLYSRFEQFFEYCWASHGIIYSLVRTEILRNCEIIGQSFMASDWAIDLYLVSHGKIHRTVEGYTLFGLNGICSSAGAYRAFRNSLIELPLPFYRLSRYVMSLTRRFSLRQRAKVFLALAKLNLWAVFDQSRAALYSFYCAVIKSRVRQWKSQGSSCRY